MLIIEGADHLGKTTAAKTACRLSAERAEYHGESTTHLAFASHQVYPTYYAHMSRPNYAFDFCYHYLDMMSDFAIQDRFHLGGLVWHEGKLTLPSLAFVEGHLMSIGSYLVVLYTSDEDWYRKKLEAGEKAEMFDVETIMAANKKFQESIPYASRMVDVMFDVKDGQWPTEEDIAGWLYAWFERLQISLGE